MRERLCMEKARRGLPELGEELPAWFVEVSWTSFTFRGAMPICYWTGGGPTGPNKAREQLIRLVSAKLVTVW